VATARELLERVGSGIIRGIVELMDLMYRETPVAEPVMMLPRVESEEVNSAF
jgi:hypothetical protein